jgi:HD-like signal output (HDOD) protein
MSSEVNVEDIVQIRTLSAMPQTAIRLLEVSQQEDIGPNKFAEPILADPGLTAQVLQYVNSSYFGFSQKIASVQLAVNLVGYKTIKNFVLWKALYDVIEQPPSAEFSLSVLWQDSLRRAIFARNFAEKCRHEAPEEVFAGALMQDMAIPLLISSRPRDYEKLLKTARTEKRRLHELEEDNFGWNHAEIGALLCERWNFPPELVSMIRQHLTPTSTFQETSAERIVTVAALLPTESSIEWNEQARLEKCVRMLIPNVKAQELYYRTDHDFSNLAPSINLSPNCKSLLQWAVPSPN